MNSEPESALPNIELLLGPYRSGKTSVLIDHLIRTKQEDQFSSVLLLVPSARYGRILKDRIFQSLKQHSACSKNASPVRGLFGLEIMPFYQCCLRVLSKAKGEPQVIPEEIRPALVSKLLFEMKAKGELSSLERIAEFHGTGAAVLELIDELQRAGLSPEDVLARLEASSAQESHLLELARVYQGYWQRLKSLDYFDQKSLALAAREELFKKEQNKEGQEENFAPKTYDLLLIDGFDRISHLQAQVFSGLARRSRLTKMTFDYAFANATLAESSPLRQSTNDYRWKDSSYEELLKNLNPHILLFDHDLQNSEDRAANGMQDYADRASQKQEKEREDKADPANLEAVSVLDPFLEMVEISRQIKAALRRRNLSESDLIVVTRSPDSYNSAIEAAFEDAGINYFIDGSSKVAELAAWRFIRNLIMLQKNDFRRKDIVDLLRSPFMNLAAISMSARDVSILDRDSYKARLIGGSEAWRRFLQNESYSSFSAFLLLLITELKHDKIRASAEIHARRIEDIVEKHMLLPESESDIRSIGAMHERETIKALRRVLKVLIMQETLLEQDKETFEQFWLRLETLIEKANFARPRPQAAAVTICSAELVPNILFKEIYISGLIEGAFPRHQSSRGFLSPDEIRLWLSFGIDIRNPRQEAGFERALFYSLTERASQRLFLSMPQFTSKGEESIESFYISELRESSGLQCKRIQTFEQSERQPVSVRDSLCAALWHGAAEKAESLATSHARLWSEQLQAEGGSDYGDFSQSPIYSRWQDLKQGVSALLSRAESAKANLFNGYLCDFFMSSAFELKADDTWTASKINDYGKCPFRFWASHILEIKPRDETEAGLNFALIGLFYHKVLELFFSALNKLPQEQSAEQKKEILAQSFAGGLAWLEARGDFQAGPYWEQEKKELYFRLNRFIEREFARLSDSAFDYKPSMFEANFGTRAPDSFPALLIKRTNGKAIILSGSIDRVDLLVDENGKKKVRIVDYKSGSRAIPVKEAERGRNLQLPIYALAVEQAILPGSSVIEADYMSISAAKSVGHMQFESEKHEHLKAHANELIQEYVARAENGVFSVAPNGREVCKDCLHSSVCRVAELKPNFAEEDDASTD